MAKMYEDQTWMSSLARRQKQARYYHPDQMFHTLPHPRSTVRPVNPYMSYPRPIDPGFHDPNRIRRVYSFNQFNNSFYFPHQQNPYGSLREFPPPNGSLQRQSRLKNKNIFSSKNISVEGTSRVYLTKLWLSSLSYFFC